mmetsp:Transcript_118626/g.215575  ORF Transcript_118626/g.215575 Transcript_118626/m.215575 type:complete len:265 (+) Transcript_118626:45-839(+)
MAPVSVGTAAGCSPSALDCLLCHRQRYRRLQIQRRCPLCRPRRCQVRAKLLSAARLERAPGAHGGMPFKADRHRLSQRCKLRCLCTQLPSAALDHHHRCSLCRHIQCSGHSLRRRRECAFDLRHHCRQPVDPALLRRRSCRGGSQALRMCAARARRPCGASGSRRSCHLLHSSCKQLQDLGLKWAPLCRPGLPKVSARSHGTTCRMDSQHTKLDSFKQLLRPQLCLGQELELPGLSLVGQQLRARRQCANFDERWKSCEQNFAK